MKQSNFDFWDSAQLAACYGQNIALVENENENETNQQISYQELDSLVDAAKKHITLYDNELSRKQLIMLVANNNISSIVYYLAALQLGHAVWWVDKDTENTRLKKLQQHYSVNLFINSGNLKLVNSQPVELHDDLALLITTSGSTGSPALVRLSYQNIRCNCTAICQSLALQTSDTTITTLPLQYSFGLSIINTHLKSGSTIILTEASLMNREFWSFFKAFSIKCLYGVPYSFTMLLKLSLKRLPLSSLRFMAVAGGRLDTDKVSLINDYCLSQKGVFYVMYGQTEASARISVLAPEKTKIKPYSIGQAITGKLWLQDEDGKKLNATGLQGEICYQGDNVMMGLAQIASDLAIPAQTDILKTGDIGLVDHEGDYQIVGRLKRMIKLLGHRINLDEVEHFFDQQQHHVICTGQDDLIFCYLVTNKENKPSINECQQLLNRYLSIHSNYSQWLIVEDIPYLSSGKVNYQQLDTLRTNSSLNKAVI